MAIPIGMLIKEDDTEGFFAFLFLYKYHNIDTVFDIFAFI